MVNEYGKRPVPRYDFKTVGEAIKAVRKGRKESRKKVCDEIYFCPHYLANIKNKGQPQHRQYFTGREAAGIEKADILIWQTM